MLLSKINSESLTEKQINKILFDIPKDDEKKGECIWVFGSKTFIDERTNLAVKLYDEKRAPIILFSGRTWKKW